MPTSSIFDNFTIDTVEKLRILLQEKNSKGRKTKKIDIDEKLKRVRKLLEDL